MSLNEEIALKNKERPQKVGVMRKLIRELNKCKLYGEIHIVLYNNNIDGIVVQRLGVCATVVGSILVRRNVILFVMAGKC